MKPKNKYNPINISKTATIPTRLSSKKKKHRKKTKQWIMNNDVISVNLHNVNFGGHGDAIALCSQSCILLFPLRKWPIPDYMNWAAPIYVVQDTT